MDKRKLLLNQARYIEAGSSNMTIPISLSTNKDIIVDDRFNEVVNEYNVYLEEREKCNKIRLTVDVNLLASNIIFNMVTEIVKYEGSGADTICLNYSATTIHSTTGKLSYAYQWGGPKINEAVMDTQISYDGKDDKNYTYLCGIDILNNHILRSKTKYASSPIRDDIGTDDMRISFNTLGEYVSSYDQVLKTKSLLALGMRNYPETVLKEVMGRYYTRRYNSENCMTFFESLVNNIESVNGWYGFSNKCQMVNDTVVKPGGQYVGVLGVDRVINNESAYKHIDFFPGRDRYTLLPHYNKYQKRYEKNWEHCLAYPYSSTTENIPFINSSLNTLKILFIDENTIDDDGVYRCIIHTMSKHGLQVNDEINLYKSPIDDDERYELVEGGLIVDSVPDDYTFSVYTSEYVCRKWISVFDNEQMSANNITHIVGNRYKRTVDGGTKSYIEYSSSDYLNIDYDDGEYIGSKNLSFAKVVNDVQCRYYVRLFSRLPNFEFYKKNITKDEIYKTAPDGMRPVDEYAKIEYERQSTLTKLGFAKNIYGDNMAEIVFNDDIDIDLLEDNLGRPLTSLYLMFFKTNYGYKEWYYKNGCDDSNCNSTDDSHVGYKSPDVEWSRCFGKLNCGFETSPYMNESSIAKIDSGFGTDFLGNIHTMNNVDERFSGGLEITWREDDDVDKDEILYNVDNVFYGDLCCYSPYECLETSIQDSYHRFNTAQRELVREDSRKCCFYPVKFDEIQGTQVLTDIYDRNPTEHREGYYYKPNYEIPVRTFSTTVNEYSPEFFDVISIDESEGDSEYIVKTSASNYLNKDDIVYLFDNESKSSYKCEIKNILDVNILKLYVTIDNPYGNASRYKLYRVDQNLPSYAELMTGTDFVYRWRDVVQNGFSEVEGLIDEYPFVNGCLYIHKNINIFLRRQDPFGLYGISTDTPYYGLESLDGESNPIEDGTSNNITDAFNERESIC